MKQVDKPLKVACVTCYFDADYIRSRTLRAGLAATANVQPIIIKNTSRDFERYTEVLWAMVKCRFQQKPDVWLLNFRGYELLPFVLLLAGRKPVIYDEFVNPVLVVEEHRSTKTGLTRQLMGLWKRLSWLYYILLRRCALVLMDTPNQAAYAASAGKITRAKYKTIPLGADETLFKPGNKPAVAYNTFNVFFYGSASQPLHGIQTILQAARLLAEDKHITFTISGNKGGLPEMVQAAVNDGAHIQHKPWIAFTDLPKAMQNAGLCLGGPFGGTTQANLVVTGKTLQMLACAAPVVVGDSPTTRHDFIDRHNALVVPQNDAVSLAEAIRWASLHPAELAGIAQRGRRLYEEHYSQQVINVAVRQALQQVAPR